MILRRYSLYDWNFLSDLSRCAWESLKFFIQKAVSEKNPIHGAVIGIQTFDDFLDRPGTMRIISITEEKEIIKTILKPQGL